MDNIYYAIYSVLYMMVAKLKGVSFSLFFCCGRLSIERKKNSSITIGNKTRFMSKWWGNRLGVNHPCMLTTAKDATLTIGNKCGFTGVSIWCFKSITIGNHVRVGANCTIMDGDAHQDDPRAGANRAVIIEDNVWLGGNVVVKKGAHIGRNTVIGMNSVVTGNIPSNCIAIGNPCQVVKHFDEDKIKQIENYFV